MADQHTVEIGCACTSSFAVTTDTLEAATKQAQQMLADHLPNCPGPGEDQREKLQMIADVAEASATDKTLADAETRTGTILALVTDGEKGAVDPGHLADLKAAARRRAGAE